MKAMRKVVAIARLAKMRRTRTVMALPPAWQLMKGRSDHFGFRISDSGFSNEPPYVGCYGYRRRAAPPIASRRWRTVRPSPNLTASTPRRRGVRATPPPRWRLPPHCKAPTLRIQRARLARPDARTPTRLQVVAIAPRRESHRWQAKTFPPGRPRPRRRRPA